jgi:hypothetical protein
MAEYFLTYLEIPLQCQAHLPPVIFIFVFLSRPFFSVRPEGEARWSAETCLFCTWRLFGGSGEVRQISLSLSFSLFEWLENEPKQAKTSQKRLYLRLGAYPIEQEAG